MKEVNNIKRGPLANCIALHDFAIIPESLKDWFKNIENIYSKNHLVPTRIGLTGKTIKSKNTTSYTHGTKTLEKCDYHGITTVSVYATPPNHGTDMFDGIFSVELNMKEDASYFVFAFDNHLMGFNAEIIESLTKDLSAFFGAQYGYAYQRKFSQGPTFYAFGVNGRSGNDYISDEEADKIMNWDNAYFMPNGKYHLGQLRDIYPYNFLSQPHLDNQIGNLSLKAWIDADPARGKLTQLTNSLWSWHVDPAHIEAVRESLKPTGLLICA